MLATKNAAVQTLQDMFERFSDSSAKLEAKYSALLKETDELKSKLREKEEEVKRSTRLAMLGETAAALAHEVRNPLGAISLFVSLLKQDVEDRPQALQLLEEISRSISSLNGVVSNILHFAKNKPAQRVPVNLHSCLMEMQQHFNATMNSGGEVKLDLSGNPFVMGDEHGLRQVFYNLIANATKAVGHHGIVNITARDSSEDLEIIIQDSGQGIAQHIMPQIFEPFVSGRADGTGLGLAIVKQIVDQHAGTIQAENNNGARFTVKLPRNSKFKATSEGKHHE